jgi:hypothetical protein
VLSRLRPPPDAYSVVGTSNLGDWLETRALRIHFSPRSYSHCILRVRRVLASFMMLIVGMQERAAAYGCEKRDSCHSEEVTSNEDRLVRRGRGMSHDGGRFRRACIRRICAQH